MSNNELKVKKDAAVSALFSLHKAAGDATAAVSDLIGHLESTGLDVSDLRKAFDGNVPASNIAANIVNTPKKARASPKNKETTPPAASDSPPHSAVNTSESASQTEPAAATTTPQDKTEDEGKKKRKRAPRDPNAPRKPLNAFLKYRNAESKRIANQRKEAGEPDLSREELSAMVKSHWDSLEETVREQMKEETKAELESYHDKMNQYKIDSASNTEEPATQASQSEPQLTQPEPATQETDESPKKKVKKDKKEKKDKKDDKKKSE